MKKIIKASSANAEVNEAWDLLESLGVSEETLSVITNINGYSLDTLDDVAYAVFGEYLDQLREDY